MQLPTMNLQGSGIFRSVEADSEEQVTHLSVLEIRKWFRWTLMSESGRVPT